MGLHLLVNRPVIFGGSASLGGLQAWRPAMFWALVPRVNEGDGLNLLVPLALLHPSIEGLSADVKAGTGQGGLGDLDVMFRVPASLGELPGDVTMVAFAGAGVLVGHETLKHSFRPVAALPDEAVKDLMGKIGRVRAGIGLQAGKFDGPPPRPDPEESLERAEFLADSADVVQHMLLDPAYGTPFPSNWAPVRVEPHRGKTSAGGLARFSVYRAGSTEDVASPVAVIELQDSVVERDGRRGPPEALQVRKVEGAPALYVIPDTALSVDAWISLPPISRAVWDAKSALEAFLRMDR